MLLKSKLPYLLTITAALALSSCQNLPLSNDKSENGKEAAMNSAENQPAADAETKKLSEALGNFIGRKLKSPEIQFDVESLVTGLRNGAAGKPSPMTDEEYEKAMLELQQKAFTAVAKNNLDAAEKFLQTNAKAQGIVEIIPGKLQYTILQEGKGEAVPEHGSPTIQYTGRFIDGTVFGTSENSEGPITVAIDNTVPGFSKGVVGMKEGEKRRLFVHPDIGYGKSGQLPPNSLLIFDVEVVKANSPDQGMSDEDLDDSVEGDEEKKAEPKKTK